MTVKRLLLLLLCLAGSAQACVIRVGYPNQDAPPYYLGDGLNVPSRPGASVELMRRIVLAVGCTPEFVRMPLPRVRVALAEGQIDMAPMSGQTADMELGEIPRDKGQPDTRRAFDAQTVIFVRTRDAIPADTDPLQYFIGRRVGMRLGARHADFLRKAGVIVDEGAVNAERNLEKLLIGRIDGVAMNVIAPNDMDAAIKARHGDAVTRLEKPVRLTRTWFVANKGFYASHTALVESIWNWIGTNGRPQLRDLVKAYEPKP